MARERLASLSADIAAALQMSVATAKAHGSLLLVERAVDNRGQVALLVQEARRGG
ncbi:hypothetical protein [Baekduia soli]|uniref:hypothetical protein n=1 Tax=Baekduia soli TaxID=496014 RepID=UPI001651B81C|nr:hypothetical protein [Baekduia soli]